MNRSKEILSNIEILVKGDDSMINYSDSLNVKKFISNLDERIRYLEESLEENDNLKNGLIREIENVKNIFTYPPVKINGLVSMCLDFDYISKILLQFTNLKTEEQVDVIMCLVIRNIEAGILEDEYLMFKSDFKGNVITNDKSENIEVDDKLMRTIDKYRIGEPLDEEEEKIINSIVEEKDNDLINSIKVIEEKYFSNLLGYSAKDIEDIINSFRNLGTDNELCYKIKNVLTRDMISRETINKLLKCAEKSKRIIDKEIEFFNGILTNEKMSYLEKQKYFNKIKNLEDIKKCFDYCSAIYDGFPIRISLSFYEIQRLLIEKSPFTDEEKATLIIELVKRNVEAGIFNEIQLSEDNEHNYIKTNKKNQKLLVADNVGYINLNYFIINTRIIYDKYLNNIDYYTEEDIEEVILSFKNLGIEEKFCSMIRIKLKNDILKRNKAYKKMKVVNVNTPVFEKKVNNNKNRTTITESEYREIRKELKKYIDLYDMQIKNLNTLAEKYYIGELLLKIDIEESRIRKFFMNADRLLNEKIDLIEVYRQNYDKYEYYAERSLSHEKLDEINSLIALFESDIYESEMELAKSLLADTTNEEDKKYLESEIENIKEGYKNLRSNIDIKIESLESSLSKDYEYEFMKISQCKDTEKLLSKIRKN